MSISSLKKFFFKKIDIRILKNANKVIFLSEFYKDNIILNYVPENFKQLILNKTSIIPNGIDNFWFKNIGIRRKLNKKVDLKILYVGNVNKNKNIISTIEAVNALQKSGTQVKFTVVGRVED